MSPQNYPDKDLTRLDNIVYSDNRYNLSNTSSRFSDRRTSFTNEPLINRETKKEKNKRIAKEKMFASWKVYNQKTENIIEIKQICKPKHKRYKY